LEFLRPALACPCPKTSIWASQVLETALLPSATLLRQLRFAAPPVEAADQILQRLPCLTLHWRTVKRLAALERPARRWEECLEACHGVAARRLDHLPLEGKPDGEAAVVQLAGLAA